MQHNGILTVGKAACAVVLSCLLATSPLLDGTVATRAFAADPGIDTPTSGATEGAAPDATKPAPDDSKYTNEVVPLVPSAPADNAQSNATPAPDQPATGDTSAPATSDTTTPTSPNTTPAPAIDRVTTDVELSTPEGDVPAKAGTVIVDGVKYTVNPDGGTAKVTGWYGTAAPKGDVVLAEKVVSGADEYRVTSIADKTFENCDEIESLTLPDSLEAVGEDAFKGCAKLQRIDAGERNETFATHDGMLFSKDLATLLICPEGKQGVAQLPESTTAFEPTAFAGCTNLTAFQVPETSATFAAIDGILYTSDRTRLLLAPANTVAVTLAPETTTIAAGAFAECANLNTIVSNAAIQQIEPGAFALNTITNAVVALSASENYDALKAVWDAAGFSVYTEPAAPGEIQQPEPQQSGFAFQLLDDYTLAVSWVGEADPEANLVIPTTAQLNGIEYKVSTIAAGGFQGREALSSVQIRAPITTIGDDAFAGCAGLASIELAEGITSIGAGAFSGTAVENATIPASVSSIGAAAFANCANLSRILTFSNAVDVAGDAIAGCTGVSIYAPYEESGAYPWNPGLVASGNHILPYGVSLPSDPVLTFVDAAVSLLESNEDAPAGYIEAPEGVEVNYAYMASTIYVDPIEATVKGKAEGISEITVTLTYNGIELARATRGVEVMHGVSPLAPEVVANKWGPVIVRYDTRGGSELNEDFYESARYGSTMYHNVFYPKEFVAPKEPQKEGYNFAGWYVYDTYDEWASNYKEEDLFDFSYSGGVGGGILFADGSDNGDYYIESRSIGYDTNKKAYVVNLHAKWTPITYNISYDLNGGSGTLPGNANDVVYDTSFTVPNSDIKKAGYEFTGWNTQTDGKGIHYQPGTSASNLTTENGKTVPLYAEWTPINRTVTFNPNGGSVSPTSKVVQDGQKVTAPSASRTGYNLDGWYSEQTGGTKWDFDNNVVTADMPLYAHWSLIPYTIKYEMNGGTQGSDWPSGYNYETSVTLPSPNREGYTFGGWFNDKSLTGTAITSIPKSTTGDKTYWAKWTADKHTVKFNSNGGDGGQTMADQTFTYDAAQTLKANVFTKTGYTFTGWNTQANGEGTPYTNQQSISDLTSDIELFAQWEIGKFQYTLGQTEGIDTSFGTQPGAYDFGTTITLNAKANNGYSFLGWTSSNPSLVPDRATNGSFLMPAGAITMTPKASLIQYSITFNTNGGSAVNSVPFNVKSSAITLPTTTRDGYTFEGWFADDQLTGTKVTTLPTGSYGDKEYWAKWTPKQYQAKFVTDGGSAVNPVTADFGATFVKPTDPSKEGYTFVGWYKEEGLQNEWDFAKDTMPLDGVTLYAKWEANTFTVTFDTLGGDAVPSAKVKYNEKVAQPATNPSRPGWTFAGWCIDTAGAFPYNFDTPVTKDFTLYASWTLKNISGTFGTCKWEITSEGTLIIHEGTLDDFPTGDIATSNHPWYEHRNVIKAVVIEPNVKAANSLERMFYGCSSIVSMDLSGLDTSTVTNMGNMFYNCSSLVSLDLSPLKTSSVTNMSSMFAYCTKLKTLDLSPLDTSSVTNMEGMFYYCSGLTSLNLSPLVTDKVTNMKCMFYTCSGLTSLNLSPLVTDNVTNMNSMFAVCSSLTALDVSPLNASNVVDTDGMFRNCAGLTSLDVSSFDVRNVGDMDYMFANCTSLSQLLLPDNFISSGVSITSVFANCPKLQVIPENLALPSAGMSGLFAILGGGDKVSTYYAGTDPNVRDYNWDADGRALQNGDCTVTFKTDNGQADVTTRGPLGGKAVRPADPTKDGLTFAGWYKDEACTQIWRFATDAVAGDTTLYAKWVTYDIAYEYPADSGQYVYYDILSSGDATTPGTVRTAAKFDNGNSPHKFLAGAVEIPETVFDTKGASYTVTEIGKQSFGHLYGAYANKVLTSLTLPDTIEIFGEHAFRSVSSLASCNIPSSTRMLGNAAFYDNGSLTHINIPASVQAIVGSALSNCRNLVAITVSEDNLTFTSVDGVLYSKDMTELHCYPAGKKDSSYAIPSTVEKVIPYAMDGSKFSKIDIPESVVSMSDGALWQNKNLQTLVLPDRLPLTNWIALGCSALNSLVLGSSVTSIPAKAFGNCTSLKSITAYGDVTSITGEPAGQSGSAFYGVDKSKVMINLPGGMIGGKSFDERKAVWVAAGFTDANVVEITETSKVIVSFDTKGGSSIKPQTAEGGLNVSKPETPTLDGKAFAGWYADAACTQGNEWDFATWVTENTTLYAKWVTVEAFHANAEGGQQLKFEPLSVPQGEQHGTVKLVANEVKPTGNLVIPSTVEDENGLLYDVVELAKKSLLETEIESLTIPNTVTTMRSLAVQRNNRMSSVSLPASLKTMESQAITECVGIASIVVDPENPYFFSENDIVMYTEDMKTLVLAAPMSLEGTFAIPSTVETVQGRAFFRSPRLTSIIIPASVKTLEDSVFSGCPRLESIEVDAASPWFRSVGGALYTRNMNILVAVPGATTGTFTIPTGVATIRDGAMTGCAVTRVVIPSTVTTIGSWAFQDSSITALVLPESISSVGFGILACPNLKTVVALGNVTKIEDTAFMRPGEVTSALDLSALDVYLPDGTVGGADFDTRAAVWKSAQAVNVNRMTEDDAASGLTYTMQNDFTLSVRATSVGVLAGEVVIPATRTLSGGVNTYPVSVVEQNAFKGSSQLKELTLPSTITTLGASAFEGSGLAGGKLHVFGDLSAEGINEGTEVTGSGSFKGLDKSKIVVDFASGVSEESKALWTERKFATSAQTFVAATFDTRGGSAIAPQRLAANTKITQPDTPTKGDMIFVGWYADPELTTEWDFNTTISADTTLYAKWKYGEGKLPTMLNGVAGTDASWEITEDGTLTIKCDKPGAQIKSLWELPEDGDANGYPREEYWSPLRDKVKHVVMEPGIKLIGEGDIPANMNYWFAGMTNLADMNGIYFPDGVEKTLHTFGWCTSVKEIPENLTFPDSLTSMNGLYYKTSIAEIPASFKLPSKLVDAIGIFTATKIVTIPKEFEIPQSVKYTGWMFSGCTSLKYLPEGFTLENLPNLEMTRTMFFGCTSLQGLPSSFRLPATISDVGSMFGKCTSLSSLPEGFSIPASVSHYEFDGKTYNGMSYVFANCPSLTTLPNSFDFPADLASEAGDSFICETNTPIRYAGENQSVLTFNWTGQKRTLVTPVDVTFNLRNGTIDGSSDPVVQKVLPGDHATRPTDPVKEGYVFDGWAKDVSNTIPWDFEVDVVEKEMTLYAGWRMEYNDTFYADVDGRELCFKILTHDGAAGTGTVRVIRNDHEGQDQLGGELVIPETVTHEGNTFTVTEIGSDLDSGLPAGVFQSCGNLTSVVIPATVKVLGINAFCDCASLKSVTFAEGSTLETISIGVFARTALSSVVLPSTVKSIGNSAFLSCPNLSSVVLNEGLETIGVTAFMNSVMTTLDLPSTLLSIGELAFGNSQNLTRVSIPASVQKIGPKAFAVCPNLATIKAESAIAFLDPTAFDTTTKQAARVLLPMQPSGGITFEQLVTTWNLTYGFMNVVGAFGALPTVNNANPTAADFETAGWSLTFDGLLEIHCKEGESIADFGWTYNGPQRLEQHWGPYRDLVTSVDTRNLTSAEHMDVWFAEMTNLTDISNTKLPGDVKTLSNAFLRSGVAEIPANFVIPNSATDISSMFNGCASITTIPDTFKIPDNAEKIGYLFGKNPNLTELPANFKIPDSVTEMAGFFDGWTSLTTVPKNFAFPKNGKLKSVAGMFRYCSSLVSLPEDFVLPASVDDTHLMFYGCSSLASLPKDFTVPLIVTDYGNMFQGCTSLTSLPDNFDLPLNASKNLSVFYVDNGPLPMYYGGSNENVINYVWEQAHRTLVTPNNRPDSTFAVTFNTKSEGEVGPGQTWTTMYTNTSGMLAEPAAPSRPGMVFALWYYDEDCTQRVDFSQPFEADTTLYGKFVAGTRGGSLPTVAGTGSAWWSLSDAGTLYVGGTGEIKAFGWSDSPICDDATNYWALYRADIVSVSMAPSVSVKDMKYWFYGCTNLTDISELVVPEGTDYVASLFWKCSSLRDVPEGFKLPDSVTEAYSMFRETAIVSLPASFIPSENLFHMSNMFYGCTNLESLPDGFAARSIRAPFMSGMFYECPSLKTLPSSFVIPEGTYLATPPFYVELAEGEPLVPIYYNGSDPGVINFDWESQNRTLISDAGDRGMFTVTYKTMDESGTWTTRTTSLTDSKGIATNPGAPLNGEYVFTGWCTDEACLNEFNFSTPLEQDQVLYGKWIKHGGPGTQEGKLPTVNDAGNAWWRLTLDGELYMECENDAMIAPLGWTYTDNKNGWWGPYRDDVRSIVMAPGVQTGDMISWFTEMHKLTDVTGVYIPDKCEKLNDLFLNSDAFTSLAPDFTLPESVTIATSMFNGAKSLEALPAGFNLPSKFENANSMFQDTKIATLPDGFRLPDTITAVQNMFSRCKELIALPDSFRLPANKVPELKVRSMFFRCDKLASLPEGFSIPSNVATMDCMFYGCSALTAFPDSFDFPLDQASDGRGTAFFCDSTVKTYFGGSPESNMMKYQYWSQAHREIVTSLPAGSVQVGLMLPDSSGAYGDVWTKLTTNDQGMIAAAPEAPLIENATFVGWFIDADCTTAFDFAKTVAEQITSEPYVLYAKYQENSGTLATVGSENDAKWEFTSDGTLRIHAGSSAIVGFEESARPWLAVKGEVRAVQMDADIKIEGPMEGWFAHFAKMKDPTGIFVPEGVTSVKRLFAYSGFETLPEGFTLPEGITSVAQMFEGSQIKSIPDSFVLPSTTEDAYALFVNTPLERLPKDFSLPANVTRATSLFYGCKALKSVPDSFVLHKNMAINYLFLGCSSLVSLPKGFTIPEPDEPMDFVGLFLGCSSLTSLPEGFDVPTKVKNVDEMFRGCTSLKYLPASLDISDVPNTNRGITSIFKSDVVEGLDTYYAGNDVSKLLPSGATGPANNYWSSTYQRTLYTGGSKPANSFKVTFMLQKPGEAESSEWMTVLLDASGKVADPLVAAPFGYAFMGWKDAAGNKFNFDTDAVTQDTTLYGTFSLVIDVDVPLKMSFALDSSNQVQAQEAQMRSFTPVPLEITSVTTAEDPVADEVIPDATARAKVGISFTPKEGAPFDLGLNDTQPVSGLLVTAAKSASSPGILDYTIGLVIPPDTWVKRYEYNRSTSIASITYQVAPRQ